MRFFIKLSATIQTIYVINN